jgi:ribosomal protein L17
MVAVTDNPVGHLTEYELEHLVAHLDASGRFDDLHRLLQLSWEHAMSVPHSRRGVPGWLDRLLDRTHIRQVGHRENAWYAARESAGETGNYPADVARAWQVAERRYDPRDIAGTGVSIGRQCRYALITASLNTVAGNIPAELLVALVQYNLWSLEQGLATVRQRPEPEGQARALAALAHLLPNSLLPEALAVGRSVPERCWRALALAALLGQLPESERNQIVPEVVTAVKDIDRAEERMEAMALLLPHLPPSQQEAARQEALAAIQAFSDDRDQRQTLVWLGPSLLASERRQTQQATLSLMLALPHNHVKAEVLALLAPHLARATDGSALLSRARGAVETMPVNQFDLPAKAEALAALMPHLPAAEPERLLADAHATASSTGLILSLPPLLSYLAQTKQMPALIPDWLAAARTAKKRRDKAEALTDLLPYLSSPQKERVLREALALACRVTVHDYAARRQALAALAPHLAQAEEAQALLRRAISAANKIKHDYDRVAALSQLVPHLPPPDRNRLLQDILSAVREVDKHKEQWVATLTSLAPRLPDPERGRVLSTALAMIGKIDDEGSRAMVRAKLAAYLPDTKLEEAIMAVTTLRESFDQRQAAQALVATLAERDQLEAAQAIVQKVEDEEIRDILLARLAPELAQKGRPKMALATAHLIDNKYKLADALSGMVPALSTPWLQEALKMARALPQELLQSRPKTLTAFVPYLAQGERERLLSELVEAQVDEEVLGQIASYLSPALLSKALAHVRAARYPRWQAKGLAMLASYLPPPAQAQVLQEALATAQTIPHEPSQAEVLQVLVSILPTSLLPQFTSLLETLERSDFRSTLRQALVVRLGQLGEREAASSLLSAAESEWLRARMVLALADHSTGKERRQALQEALAAARARRSVTSTRVRSRASMRANSRSSSRWFHAPSAANASSSTRYAGMKRAAPRLMTTPFRRSATWRRAPAGCRRSRPRRRCAVAWSGGSRGWRCAGSASRCGPPGCARRGPPARRDRP